MKKVFLASIILFSFVSCRKERSCECTNSNGTYDAGTVDQTKSQAKKYCEGLSVGDTKCKLKN
jgi:hypothetical protein